MKKTPPLTAICFFVLCYAFAQQNRILLKSTLTQVGGGSVIHSVSGQKYRVTQSIGQSGIIGSITLNNFTVQQGFLTNYNRFSTGLGTIKKNPKQPIVYPNPTKQYLNIFFEQQPKSKIRVNIFDLAGRLVISKTFETDNTIFMDLEPLQDATYLLQITADAKNWGAEVIKVNY